MQRALLTLVVFGLALAADGPRARAQAPLLDLEPLPHEFAFVTEIANGGDGSGRLYVVEKRGTIRVVEGNGSLAGGSFLDIQDKVGDQGAEQGLLGLAFSPNFETDRHFYVNYTDNDGDTRVERYTAMSGTDADEDSLEPVLLVEQPASNHNGGHLAFGPDGWLYIGMGDGGGAGDPDNHAQTSGDPLGKLLRYNPASGLVEEWAKGLRNPWKFSFDRATGDLYIADVGQNNREEVNFVPAGAGPGLNFGWRIMEGSACYPAGTACSTEGLVLPVTDYGRAEGCSVTGGYVVREPGSAVEGTYVFSDYCRGIVWGLRRGAEGRWEREVLGTAPGNVSTFGEGEDRAVYLATAGMQGNRIYRLRAAATAPADLPFRVAAPGLASDR